MRSRARVIAAGAVAAGGAGAAMASTTGTKPGAPPKTVSASAKSAGGTDLGGDLRGSKAALANAAGANAAPRPGADALPAAVAGELHVTAARAATALRPLLAGGMIDSSSPEFAAAARSLGVSPQQLFAALAQAKQSLAGGK